MSTVGSSSTAVSSVGFAAICGRPPFGRWERAYPSRVPADLPAPWREVRAVRSTGSTNADLAAEADAGAAEGLVLVAEHQSAGRGRLDRRWEAPAGSGLTFSVLLRPAVPPARLGWLPLLTGLAVVDAVRAATGVPARVKWPNDVLVGERKLAGVLAELRPAGAGVGAGPDAVVVGVGLNVGLADADLPVPAATSLRVEGATTLDHAVVLDAVLTELGARYRAWVAAGGDAEAGGLRAAYTVRCATVGRAVRVELAGPTGAGTGAAGEARHVEGEARHVEGEALGVDAEGRLRVAARPDGVVRAVAAGDVVHLR